MSTATAAAITDAASPLLRAITEEEIQHYQRDGVVCVRDILRPEWVDMIRDGVEEQRKKVDAKASAYATVFRAGTSYAMFQHMAHYENEKLRRVVYESGAGLIARAMLRAPRVRYFFDDIFYKEPGRVIETPWHQDTASSPFDGVNGVRIWMPADPVPRETSLEVVRASHLWNVTYSQPEIPDLKAIAETVEGQDYYFNHKPDSLPPVPDIQAHRDSFDIVGHEVNPGDVVVFNYNLLHRGGAAENVAHKRRVFAAIYCDDSLKVKHRPNMVPNPFDRAGQTYKDGQSIADFPDIFKVV